MKDYKELLESMRYCASIRDGSICAGCLYNMRTGGECVEGLLAEAANEIEELLTENKELRDERDVDHDANIALYSALEEDRKKHEWVSVKDRLPVTNEDVLVSGVYGNEKKRRYTDVGWFNYRASVWYAEGDVTHWMPLPDPPKEEEE